MGLQTRIILAFLILSGSVFLWVAYRVDRHVRPAYLGAIESDLVDTASLLAAAIAVESQPTSPILALDYVPLFVERAVRRPLDARIYDVHQTQFGMRIVVTDARGIVVFDSQGSHVGQDYSTWKDIRETLNGRYGVRTTFDPQVGGEVLHVASPIQLQDIMLGVVSVSKPAVPTQVFWAQVRREVLLGLVFIGATLLIWGLLVSVWVTTPLKRLRAWAQSIESGARQTPPELPGADYQRLTEAFENMRKALEGKQYVEQYVQSLTHEIKGPLAAIRAAAELIDARMPEEKRARFLGNILNESSRLQKIVDNMLELSDLEAQEQLRNPQWVSMTQIVQSCIAAVKALPKASHLDFCLSADKPFEVHGDAFLLNLAISNLLRNAIDFTPEGGRIQIHFGQHSLTIRDSGPGIPSYATHRIFSRFFSLPAGARKRKSSGLGLAIVRQISQLHEGGIQLRNAEGGGAEAILWFPSHKVRH